MLWGYVKVGGTFLMHRLKPKMEDRPLVLTIDDADNRRQSMNAIWVRLVSILLVESVCYIGIRHTQSVMGNNSLVFKFMSHKSKL